MDDIVLQECHLRSSQQVKCFKKGIKQHLKELVAFTYVVADDIIIAASSIEEHDNILQQVLNRAIEQNVKLNFDKFQLCVSTVNYLGSVITHQGIKPETIKVKAIAEMPTPCDKSAV